MSEQVGQTPQELLTEYVTQLEVNARQTAAIHGLSGLDIVINPGAGWSTLKTEQGVQLTIDPLRMAHGLSSEELESANEARIVEMITQTDRRYTNYAISHEIGHIKDMVDPEYEANAPPTKSDHYFKNVIDDVVINVRNRNVPALDDCTDEIYREVLFPDADFSDRPQHIQLMYGLLINTITGDRPTLDDSVQSFLNDLKTVQAGGETYDIMRVLTDSSTTLEERRHIAEQFIRPKYEELYEAELEKDPRSGEEEFSHYEAVMHGAPGKEAGDTEDRDGDDKHDHQEDEGLIHAAMQQAAAEIKKATEDGKQAAKEEAAPESGSSDKDKDKRSRSFGAGSIIKELQLPRDEAQLYMKELLHYKAAIWAVAKEFERIAIPSPQLASPRYASRARYSGQRLHSHRLAQAAIQLHTGVEQPIWRSLELRGRRVDFALEKLDVHLLVDVSVSMMGLSAEHASATGLMLLEGLELARHNLSKRNVHRQKPDVRVGVTAFGSDMYTIVPLTNDPSLQQRSKTFSALLSPNSYSTHVSGALEEVTKAANKYPGRNQLVFIISDGQFYDQETAQVIADNLQKKNAYIAQFIITAPRARPISEHASHLDSPELVPAAVRDQLQAYMNELNV